MGIKAKDMQTIAAYASIYAAVQGDESLSAMCAGIKQAARSCKSEIAAEAESMNAKMFFNLCRYAVASVVAADEQAQEDVCSIILRYADMMDTYTLSSILTIAEIQADALRQKGEAFRALADGIKERRAAMTAAGKR